MMPTIKPNARYRHAYAIIRVDDYFGPDRPVEHNITVKKVVATIDEAESEVGRLNGLRAGRRGRYAWKLTRIDVGMRMTGDPE